MPTYNLPNWVSTFKEKGKTIKIRNGKYYLFEQICIYDKNRKHKNKKEENYLGRITKENGLIPVKIPRRLQPESVVAKDYGSYALIKQSCDDIYLRLRNIFGDYANLIFTIASLRTIEKTPYYELEDAYNESYFSVFDKTLSMSKSSLSDFLYDLSIHKDKFKSYMMEDVKKDDTLIFDGTNLLCGSQNISYSGVGYKHGHNYSSQVNQLYAYSPNKRKMVYYKLFEGSVPDSKSLSDIINEMNVERGIAIIDNGFVSEDNIKGILGSKSKYIVALRRDSNLVTKEIINDSDRVKALEKFTNNHESIYAYDVEDSQGNRICIYFNQTIIGVETSEYLDKMVKGWKGYTEENFQKEKKRFGIFVIKTNIHNFSLKKIYEYYKSRFEIEYMFDTIKNTLEFDKVYMHSDESFESWAFINHISICIATKMYDLLKDKEINISLHSLFKKLRQVVKQRSIIDKNDNFVLQVIPKKTKDILDKLGVNL